MEITRERCLVYLRLEAFVEHLADSYKPKNQRNEWPELTDLRNIMLHSRSEQESNPWLRLKGKGKEYGWFQTCETAEDIVDEILTLTEATDSKKREVTDVGETFQPNDKFLFVRNLISVIQEAWYIPRDESGNPKFTEKMTNGKGEVVTVDSKELDALLEENGIAKAKLLGTDYVKLMIKNKIGYQRRTRWKNLYISQDFSLIQVDKSLWSTQEEHLEMQRLVMDRLIDYIKTGEVDAMDELVRFRMRHDCDIDSDTRDTYGEDERSPHNVSLEKKEKLRREKEFKSRWPTGTKSNLYEDSEAFANKVAIMEVPGYNNFPSLFDMFRNSLKIRHLPYGSKNLDGRIQQTKELLKHLPFLTKLARRLLTEDSMCQLLIVPYEPIWDKMLDALDEPVVEKWKPKKALQAYNFPETNTQKQYHQEYHQPKTKLGQKQVTFSKTNNRPDKTDSLSWRSDKST